MLSYVVSMTMHIAFSSPTSFPVNQSHHLDPSCVRHGSQNKVAIIEVMEPRGVWRKTHIRFYIKEYKVVGLS